jgi:hypothetical protein
VAKRNGEGEMAAAAASVICAENGINERKRSVKIANGGISWRIIGGVSASYLIRKCRNDSMLKAGRNSRNEMTA